ncbi:MAG TPA: hypothetical protein VLG71_02470 [Candidatus Limnocylindria bacterium]|nr:hypothetical protein [Candidatus Limnocylindria bacterium]
MNHDNQNDVSHDNQFILSYELLTLLQWMVIHESPKLKRMIAKAMRSGLKQEIERSLHVQHQRQTAEDAQYNVVEFFGMLEALLAETINEQTVQIAMEKNLMPAIDQIDGSVCDDDTIRLSVEKATAALSQKPSANPQDTLFEELLKHWKPSKKSIAN